MALLCLQKNDVDKLLMKIKLMGAKVKRKVCQLYGKVLGRPGTHLYA